MIDPGQDIEQEIAAMSRRISRFIRQGHATVIRHQHRHRTTGQVMAGVPADQRDKVAAATRKGMAEARREDHPDTARRVDREMEGWERGGHDRDLRAALDERTDQIRSAQAQTQLAREEAAAERARTEDVRAELANDRDLGSDARNGVMAGLAIAAAVDNEALASVAGELNNSPAPDVGADQSIDNAVAAPTGERTVGVDELLEKTNQHSMPDMLAHAAESPSATADAAAAPPEAAVEQTPTAPSMDI